MVKYVLMNPALNAYLPSLEQVEVGKETQCCA